MRLLVRTVGLVTLTAMLGNCANRNAAVDSRPRRDSAVITRNEMEKARYGSLFEVVQALRGRWLQARGPSTLLSRPSEIQVMVDDMRMGGVDALRTLRTDNVVSIAFFDPVTAAQRWGGKHVQGTIVVTTRADGAP